MVYGGRYGAEVGAERRPQQPALHVENLHLRSVVINAHEDNESEGEEAWDDQEHCSEEPRARNPPAAAASPRKRAVFPAGLNATRPSSVEAILAPVLGVPVERGKWTRRLRRDWASHSLSRPEGRRSAKTR